MHGPYISVHFSSRLARNFATSSRNALSTTCPSGVSFNQIWTALVAASFQRSSSAPERFGKMNVLLLRRFVATALSNLVLHHPVMAGEFSA